jgi:hypothetical protein
MSKSTVIIIIVVVLSALGSVVSQGDSHESLHPQDHRRHHRHNTEAVFWQKIGDQVWSADYGNPCQSGPSDYDGEENFDPASMVSSLSVADREDTLRAKAGNLLARLRHLERFVVIIHLFYFFEVNKYLAVWITPRIVTKFGEYLKYNTVC